MKGIMAVKNRIMGNKKWFFGMEYPFDECARPALRYGKKDTRYSCLNCSVNRFCEAPDKIICKNCIFHGKGKPCFSLTPDNHACDNWKGHPIRMGLGYDPSKSKKNKSVGNDKWII